MGQTCKVCRAWEAYADVGQSDWTPPRGSERLYSFEMFIIESRRKKKEVPGDLTEARRGGIEARRITAGAPS